MCGIAGTFFFEGKQHGDHLEQLVRGAGEAISSGLNNSQRFDFVL